MWFLEHENFHLFTTFFLHIKIHSSKNLNNSFIRESFIHQRILQYHDYKRYRSLFLSIWLTDSSDGDENDATKFNAAKAKAKTTKRNIAKNVPIQKRTPMTAYTKRQQSIWDLKVKLFKSSKHRSTASIHPSIHNIDE